MKIETNLKSASKTFGQLIRAGHGGAVLSGPPGCGKTRLVMKYAALSIATRPSEASKRKASTRCAYSVVPVPCREPSSLLRAIGEPFEGARWRSRPLSSQLPFVVEVLRLWDVGLLFIDEVQHIQPRYSHTLRRELSVEFLYVIERLMQQFPIVFVGIDRPNSFLSEDVRENLGLKRIPFEPKLPHHVSSGTLPSSFSAEEGNAP